MKHGSVGTELTQAEWEAITAHVLDAQAIGDIIYASSATQLRRLAIGAADTVLVVSGGIPAWVAAWELLQSLLAKSRFWNPDAGKAWTNTLVGSGAITDYPFAKYLSTGATNSSSALCYTSVLGFNNGAREWSVDWTKKLSFFFSIHTDDLGANAIVRIQIKEASGLGILAQKGIGLVIDNYACTGEAYGTSRGTVDLATTLTNKYEYRFEIRLTSTGVEFFINNVSKGSITTAGLFPSTMTVDTSSNGVLSIEKGAVATVFNTYIGNLVLHGSMA